MPMQVNITAKVNSASIRREQHNGREHIVIPSYTLPANVVMNGGLYPASEIDAHYKALEGTLAPLGHPTVNGKFVSAFSPEGIHTNHVGAFNRNVKKVGSRIAVEKWLDVEFAKNSENGRRLLERIEALEKGETADPIHTSIAVFLDREPATNAEYQWVARIHSVDHDAILLDEPGAATPEQGVGLMVNADQAVTLKANSGALEGESFGDKQRRLEQAARDRFVHGDNDYVWIADFTDSQAVIVRNGGDAEVFGYRVDGGRIVFDDTGSPVERRESWVSKLPTVNQILKLLFNNQARPDQPEKEGDMPLTTEEKAELVKDIGANTASAIKELADTIIKPLADKVDSLQANQKALTDSLQANQKAEDDKMREAIKAKFGEVVANSLQGDALKEMFKQCDSAAGILNGNASDQPVTGAPDPKTYGGAQ
ncbi:hypothetical protein [Pseudomonas citronellolis]|uniref:hypothetical protein n=1 Tax=Pseudomonas citronellolis TaxID=53408 RepID=UPI002D78235D|nr:hypothetical protein [Pseudomonas citronellolis]WRT83474.1 hypothetical protein VK748_03340 [Pseudomonas citronellolis]